MHMPSLIAGIGPDVETGVGVLVCVGVGVALVTKKRVGFPRYSHADARPCAICVVGYSWASGKHALYHLRCQHLWPEPAGSMWSEHSRDGADHQRARASIATESSIAGNTKVMR